MSTQSLPCDVTTSGQPFGPNSLTFGTPKNSTVLKTLNNALLEARQLVLIAAYVSQYSSSGLSHVNVFAHDRTPQLSFHAGAADSVAAQVESNGVLDQLIRKWTTEIDQCADGATVRTWHKPDGCRGDSSELCH